jgi:hypothetical protein
MGMVVTGTCGWKRTRPLVVIGDSEVWFFSMMWEKGADANPVEFLDHRHLV